MNGEVKISILQWEKLNDELKSLRTLNKDLSEKVKQVKLVLVEKNTGGHWQFSRWTNMNEWIPESHTVERSEYIGLDDVTRILYQEAEDKVQSTIQNLEAKQNELNASVRTLKKTHDEKIRLLNEEHDEKIRKCKEGNTTALKDKDNEILKLQEELTGKKNQSEMDRLISKIAELESELETAKSKIPWWKKNV